MAPDPYLSRYDRAEIFGAPAPEGGVMSRASRIPNLGGAQRVRPAPAACRRCRRSRASLSAIGLDARSCWPELPAEALAADFVFFDADLGFDEQLPWEPGEAPMPLIALIGSEAPGRIEWALSHKRRRAAAQAGRQCRRLQRAADRPAEIRGAQALCRRDRGAASQRVAERQTIVRAVAAPVGARPDDGRRPIAQLRSLAMDWQISIEEAARRIVAMTDEEAAMTDPVAPDIDAAACRHTPAPGALAAGCCKRPLAAVRPRHHRDRRCSGAIFAPWLTPYDPDEQFFDGLTLEGAPLPPNAHSTGSAPTCSAATCSPRILYGARTSLIIGIVANGVGAADRRAGRHHRRLFPRLDRQRR